MSSILTKVTVFFTKYVSPNFHCQQSRIPEINTENFSNSYRDFVNTKTKELRVLPGKLEA